ncbi:MAG: alpha/beta hydrolase [Legionella sp.]|nr:MAG: alpha/beta hydrolase [Legionella sp.]
MRIRQAALIAKMNGWHKHTIHTTLFTLQTYGSPPSKKANTLTIYLEGDGLAWLSEDTPSANPTPITPTALKMATHDQKNNPIAYLARPCQFVLKKDWAGCQRAYWTHWRFSPKVIHAMNEAVDQLKLYYHAKHLVLIGYSGGGTIAALISARRNDVVQLITVAAILDTDFWVRQDRLTPLNGSLNPADAWRNLIFVPQTHWVGGKDTVVPKAVAFAFAKRFPATKKPQIIVIPTFDHACCWATFNALISGASSDSYRTQRSTDEV